MDREESRRAARFLQHEFGRLDFSEVRDLRGERGRKTWSVEQYSRAMVAGMVAGRTGFAGLERLSARMSGEFRQVVGVPRRIPDTTVRDYVVKADVHGYRSVLRSQAHSLYRSKCLERRRDFPIHMMSIDGKYRSVWVQEKEAGQYPFFQQKGETEGERQRGEVRTITVSLVSSRSTFVLDCIPVRAETNEMGMFPDVMNSLLEDWGQTELCELIATDAGSASLHNATLVDEAGLGYLMVLNDFQPELLKEAERQLEHRTDKDADATWTQTSYQGKTVEYRLWVSCNMAGWNGWDHLRQVLRVERRVISEQPGEPVQVGTRYFLSNLTRNRLSPAEWIHVIRARWSVENGVHWTLDAILGEDNRPWTRNPHGMLVAQMLRRMALNILALYRGVHLRSKENRGRPWRHFLEDFYDVIQHADELDLLDRRQLRRRLAIAA